MTCQRCYLEHKEKECPSLTCARHRDYWKLRTFQQNIRHPMPEWMNDRIETCRLHVGFIFIDEDDEMIEALSKPDDTLVNQGASYSQIERCQYNLNPVNWTAARVAAWISTLRLPH